MSKKKHEEPTLFFWFNGLCLALAFSAVLVACLYSPYQTLSSYLNLLFMDTLKLSPSQGLTGLVITENEITTEAPEDSKSLTTGRIDYPSFGEQYASLSIESISLFVPVYWGSSSELLALGACQSSSSVVLGEEGRVVIDAHVNTFFADLESVEVGDKIVLYTNYGKFTYVASEIVEFEDSDKSYITPKDEDMLTLYTCRPQVLGTSNLRYAVLCDLVEKIFYYEEEGE